MPSGGNCPQHQERSVVRRIERGFDFLGYHFRPGQLTVAKKTIEQFIERAIRLYEQERERPEGPSALGSYVRRWVGWVRAGLRRPLPIVIDTYRP